MATDSVIKARVSKVEKELFIKKCKVTGSSASERIRWLIHHDIENDNNTIDKHALSIIQDMYERVGFVRDALLVTISDGPVEYEKLKQFCMENNIFIQLYDPNDTIESREGLTTGQE